MASFTVSLAHTPAHQTPEQIVTSMQRVLAAFPDKPKMAKIEVTATEWAALRKTFMEGITYDPGESLQDFHLLGVPVVLKD